MAAVGCRFGVVPRAATLRSVTEGSESDELPFPCYRLNGTGPAPEQVCACRPLVRFGPSAAASVAKFGLVTLDSVEVRRRIATVLPGARAQIPPPKKNAKFTQLFCPDSRP